MPSLIANYQDKETVTKLKKFYSVMSQAYLLIEAEEGPFGSWTSDNNHDGADSIIMGEKFAPYLKVIKTCAPGESGCWAPGIYKRLNGTNWVNVDGSGYIYRAVLADGIAISMYQYVEPGVKSMVLDVDVNGAKPPNQLGKDTFRFSTDATTVVLPSCTGWDAAFVDADLLTPGIGECGSLWIITHENLDYLRCPEQLSWGGKTKCD